MGRPQVGHHVDVVGGAGLAVKRAGERPCRQVGNAQPLEDAGDQQRDVERIGEARGQAAQGVQARPLMATVRRRILEAQH
jgi:hypothetical protein